MIYQYARQGITLSIADTLIGVTALEHNLTLVTTNAKHFPMSDSPLHLVDPAEL